MKKFLTIVRASWQRTLTYRFTIVAYRIGEICETIILVLMWSAIYANQTIISGLTLREMVTYILVGNLFNAVVRNFLSNVIARDIKDGRLSVFLIKPIGYFYYILSQEVGRISLVTCLSALSAGLVIAFFTDTFIWNGNIAILVVLVVMVILAFITELLLSYLIGLIAFWTDEVDGIYHTIDRIKKFFSGGYFPINLLPAVFVQISFLLPFAYSFFIPAQLYLQKIDLSVGLKGMLVQMLWIALLYGIIHVVWRRGLKRYEGVGI